MNDKIVIMEDEIEADKAIPNDIRTSKLLLEIANSISGFIKLTADSPSLHESGWMPILDLQVKVENNQIQYKFYKKPVANPLLMRTDSAMKGTPAISQAEVQQQMEPPKVSTR